MEDKKIIRLIVRKVLNEAFPEEKRYKIDISLPEDIIKIKNIFINSGYKIFLVGGSVRDALLHKTPKDYDLATDASPDKVIEILKGQSFIKNILEIGKSFGVINVITDLNEYEIATFREDTSKGRKPSVSLNASISTDSLRRDLTINALYYDIDTKEVIDLVSGIDDLKHNIIRTVGKPQDRFDEDPLRKIRSIRFAARFGSKLDDETSNALKINNNLDGVSSERIRDEFLKGIKTTKSVKYFLELLRVYGFLEI